MKLVQEALSHLDDLYAFALRLAQNPQRAEDLVQDTFLRLMSMSAPDPLSLRPYLFRTLRNLHIDQWRHQQIGDDLQFCSEPVVEAPEQILLQDMLSEWVESALGKLEWTLRETLWLREVEGFSYAEISQITDAPLGTVRSRLSRARAQMQLSLERPAMALRLMNSAAGEEVTR